jgi:hypothetical protein
VSEQQKIDAHLKNDRRDVKIPDFPNLEAWHPGDDQCRTANRTNRVNELNSGGSVLPIP